MSIHFDCHPTVDIFSYCDYIRNVVTKTFLCGLVSKTESAHHKPSSLPITSHQVYPSQATKSTHHKPPSLPITSHQVYPSQATKSTHRKPPSLPIASHQVYPSQAIKSTHHKPPSLPITSHQVYPSQATKSTHHKPPSLPITSHSCKRLIAHIFYFLPATEDASSRRFSVAPPTVG
ncbi:hypothetical protein BgiMline_018980 [Biomphalaria glabrata]|nr:hypothetical protein BgiMline_006569 [Biomphalaria glabrata]